MVGAILGVQSCENWKIAKRLNEGTAQLEYINPDKLRDIVVTDSYGKTYTFYGQEDGTYKGLNYLVEKVQQKQQEIELSREKDAKRLKIEYKEKLNSLNQKYQDEHNKLE